LNNIELISFYKIILFKGDLKKEEINDKLAELMNKISSSDKFIFLKLVHQLIKQEINQVNKIEFKTNLDKSKSCSSI
jgi:pimeloyl-CoA synthetase